MKICKIFTLLTLLPIPALICADIHGSAELRPISSTMVRIEDKEDVESFKLWGLVLHSEIYDTDNRRLIVESIVSAQFGNRSTFHQQFMGLGYVFNPFDQLSLRPYFGISHETVQKKYSVSFDGYTLENLKLSTRTTNGIFGTKIIYIFNEGLIGKLNLSVGIGSIKDKLAMNEEFRQYFQMKYKSRSAIAKTEVELLYAVSKDTCLTTKFGSSAFLNDERSGYGESHVSLGYRFNF